MNKISPKTTEKILQAQKNEITESRIYTNLSDFVKDENNKKVLKQIADDEMRHYEKWKRIIGKDAEPDKWKIKKYTFISKFFGITFGIKLMEGGEKKSQVNYELIAKEVPEAKNIEEEEKRHEQKLISMIDEERMRYVGSIVLGLNDALIELTGALAGFTLAFQNSKIIAIAGLITGIAASLSMASSEYLSTKAEVKEIKSPFKSAIYTGIAYILTVVFLIFPYFISSNLFIALAVTLLIAISIIAFFNYYISVVRDLNFKKHFIEMAGLSLGIALFSFLVGYFIRSVIGIEI